MARTHPLLDEAAALDQSHLATRRCANDGEGNPRSSGTPAGAVQYAKNRRTRSLSETRRWQPPNGKLELMGNQNDGSAAAENS